MKRQMYIINVKRISKVVKSIYYNDERKQKLNQSKSLQVFGYNILSFKENIKISLFVVVIAMITFIIYMLLKKVTHSTTKKRRN